MTLSRTQSGTITVDYATSDGTAGAGSDYTASSGTLSFAAGETSKTLGVVLDDEHDEGEETLTLSNASNGHITDATATGTISNHDARPIALVARFGRTAAMHDDACGRNRTDDATGNGRQRRRRRRDAAQRVGSGRRQRSGHGRHAPEHGRLRPVCSAAPNSRSTGRPAAAGSSPSGAGARSRASQAAKASSPSAATSAPRCSVPTTQRAGRSPACRCRTAGGWEATDGALPVDRLRGPQRVGRGWLRRRRPAAARRQRDADRDGPPIDGTARSFWSRRHCRGQRHVRRYGSDRRCGCSFASRRPCGPGAVRPRSRRRKRCFEDISCSEDGHPQSNLLHCLATSSITGRV